MHHEETEVRSLLADEDILHHYQILTDLKNDSSVLLVEDSDSGELRVMKYKKNCNLHVLSRLKNCPVPGIPRIYEVKKEKDHILTIEEYIHGRNLRQAMEREGLFSEEKVLECLLSLCRILKKLHNMDPPIIHRDIKPENIILTNDGAIRLIDFNGSKEAGEKKARDTVLFGTHQFAAPEQYGFGSSDCRTDIYQLGITMNLLLTGSFPVDSLYEGRLGSVIQKCTRYDAKERYQTIGELEKALGKPKKSRHGFSFMNSGFPSRIPWKMILTSCLYTLILNPCFHPGVSEEMVDLMRGFQETGQKIGAFFILILPVFPISDRGEIQKHFSYSGKAARIQSILLTYMAFFVILIALIFLSEIICLRYR